MKPNRLFILIGWWLLTSAVSLWADGSEVVVVYNRKLDESKSLAYYYARLRQVPQEQVLGFELSDGETMSRGEFRGQLQLPLQQQLQELKLWQIGKGELPDTNNTRRVVARKVVASKIRYLVLCYGVPLKIRRDNELSEPIAATLRPELRRNEAAVDSELACLPLAAQGYPLTGPTLNLFYGVTNAAEFHPTNGILIVARLDGPNAAIARGLVDKALEAERDGLWGRAYFDVRNISDPSYKPGDDWIREAAKMSQVAGFDTTIDENGATFPVGFPMSHIALYMGWYQENVSGPFTLPRVEFMPGAFAYHLHSYSANSLRTTERHWVGPLLAKGATCTMGCVDEPYLSGTPDLGVFTSRWLLLGFDFGTASYAAQLVLSWQTTVVGDPLYRPAKTSLQEHFQTFTTQTNRLAEWAIERVINLNRERGMNLSELTTFLEGTPLTRQSAVLSEKLAELYFAQGKPSSAILMYERALEHNPSPQQRLRLRLELGRHLTDAGRNADAIHDYEQLLAEIPDYADAASIRQKINSLAPTPEAKSR